jgi:hypothetical protein
MFGLNLIGFKSKKDVENFLLKINGITIPKKKPKPYPQLTPCKVK